MEPNETVIARFDQAAAHKSMFRGKREMIDEAYANLVFPDHHIWEYCLPIGQHVNNDGNRIDLGLNLYEPRESRTYTLSSFCYGNVWGTEDSQYSSGDLHLYSGISKPTAYRAVQLGLIKQEWLMSQLLEPNDMFNLFCNSTLSGYDLHNLFKASQYRV